MILWGLLPGYVNRPPPRYVTTERPYLKREWERAETDEDVERLVEQCQKRRA